jgi:hypothetical protein
MIESMLTNPMSPNILEQAVTNIIKAVAIEKAALADILNLESEIIKKAKTESVNLEEFVAINESVNSIISNINKVQTLTQSKMQDLQNLLNQIADLTQNYPLEE